MPHPTPSRETAEIAGKDCMLVDTSPAVAGGKLPLLTDEKLIAASCATAKTPLSHQHIAKFLPHWRAFVRHLGEQDLSGAPVDAEQFLDGGLADVQDEGGVLAYYSKAAVLECISAALEHAALERVIASQKQSDGIDVPGLHPATVDLVRRFSKALAEKLAAAEEKYGYSDGWISPDWMDECRAKLLEHIAKGDPRDVAAYCAFLWHHGESTNVPLPISRAEWMAEAKKAYMEAGDDEALAIEMSRYLCDQQDWLGEEVGEPRAEVQEELRGRPSPLHHKTALDFFADDVEASLTRATGDQQS